VGTGESCGVKQTHHILVPFRVAWEAQSHCNVSVSADLDSFPVMVQQDADGTERRAAARRSAEYVHDTEIIFIMPSLQMHLKTEHLQTEHEPRDDGMERHITVHYPFFIHCVPLTFEIQTCTQDALVLPS